VGRGVVFQGLRGPGVGAPVSRWRALAVRWEVDVDGQTPRLSLSAWYLVSIGGGGDGGRGGLRLRVSAPVGGFGGLWLVLGGAGCWLLGASAS
jgi:hypothetical protein